MRRWLALLAVATAGCNFTSPVAAGPKGLQTGGLARAIARPGLLGNGKISHVVIIVQENRSVDDLFNGLPGADTVTSGLNSAGQSVSLQQISLKAPYDLDHMHRAFAIEHDSGAMDGFNLEHASTCKGQNGCIAPDVAAYGIVPQTQVHPYFVMAEEYAFADRMFQTNEGPSFPAHQYLLSGTSTISQGSSRRASENPLAPTQKFVGGCDSPTGSQVLLIDASGEETQSAYPCFDRPSLTDLADAKGLTWHYYVNTVAPGLWNAPDAIKHIRDGSEYATDVIAPSSQVLTDIANGDLANVVWVTPSPKASDHALITNGSGPAWVASVVNAIGESQYWDNTAIFLTWDDWGGWYDHVKPPEYNAYELGFRVPMVVISAYAKQGYVSHRQHEFGSVLKFVEKAFDLGSLGTTDVRADDFADCFNFAGSPRTFKRIPSMLPAAYFLKQPISMQNPDDDF